MQPFAENIGLHPRRFEKYSLATLLQGLTHRIRECRRSVPEPAVWELDAYASDVQGQKVLLGSRHTKPVTSNKALGLCAIVVQPENPQ